MTNTQLWLWVQDCSCSCGNRWTHSYTTGVHGGDWIQGVGIRYYTIDKRNYSFCFRCMPVTTPSLKQYHENLPPAVGRATKPPAASDEDLMI